MARRVPRGVRIFVPMLKRGRARALLAALVGLASLSGSPSLAEVPLFRPIAGDGLGYLELPRGGAVYHLLRVDLARHALRVVDARREGRRAATVDELGREAQALAAVNGTFFDEKYRPLGLVASAGRELNPLRNVSWWAAFLVREQGSSSTAEILTTAQLQAIAPAERGPFAAAVQAGPRTVVEGRPLKLQEQSAARTSVCVLDPTHVILLATEGAAVESNDLAAFMAAAPADGGLGCESGLMFDGGPSTQLWIDAPGLERHVRGGWAVPNALVVLPAAAR
jgi:uncharacterized protein YigE (DUF2233 family)